MIVLHHHHDFGLAVDLELLHPELLAQVLVDVQFVANVGQLLGGFFLGAADQDHIVAGAEEHFGEDVVEGESRGLGVVPRGDTADLRVGAGVELPRLAVKGGSGLGLIVAGGQEGPGERLDQVSGKEDGGWH